MHNYWLSCLHRESQTLTSIFLLKHDYLSHDSHIISSYLKTITKNQVYFVQWSSWKFLLYPPWISITLELFSYVAFEKLNQIYVKTMSIIFCFSQNDLSEARENFWKYYQLPNKSKWSMRAFLKKITKHTVLKKI